MLRLKELTKTPLFLLSLLLAVACGDGGETDDSNAGSGGKDPGMAGASPGTGGGKQGAGGAEPGSGGATPSTGGTAGADPGTGGTAATCEEGGDPCDDGFECDDSGDEIVCVDIDECEDDTSLCAEHARCENTEGSYECTCEDGYEGDGEECMDVDECTEGTDDCPDELYCVNSAGSFSCEPCPPSQKLQGETCVAALPHVVSSTPDQAAVGVYPAEDYWDPRPGRGVRERVFVHLTFDQEMNTEKATVVVTDKDGLEEPRTIEGTWDETGRILTAVIHPENPGDATTPLADNTTYEVNFSGLLSSLGAAADPEDATYPNAVLTFTTGARDALINHACMHTQHGPFDEVTASTSQSSFYPGTETAHTHYTINMPVGEEGEPKVGYTFLFPVATGNWVFYARGASALQLETATYSEGFSTWTAAEIVQAPPACYSVDSVLEDPGTGERTAGPPVTGITHQTTLSLSEDEFYAFRWTTTEDQVQIIVEYAGSD